MSDSEDVCMHKDKKSRKNTLSPLMAVRIITMNYSETEWLIEWSDLSRSWVTFDTLKDLPIFRKWVIEKFRTNAPSYIG